MFNALFGIKQIYLHHKTVEQTVKGAVLSSHITFSNDFLPVLQEIYKIEK